MCLKIMPAFPSLNNSLWHTFCFLFGLGAFCEVICYYSSKKEIISASQKSISLAQSPLSMSAHGSCFVFTWCDLKTVGLHQQSSFTKWLNKYISASLPSSSKILISVYYTLSGWALIRQAFMWCCFYKMNAADSGGGRPCWGMGLMRSVQISN